MPSNEIRVRWSEVDKAKARQLREQGMHSRDIAPILGKTPAAVEGFFRWHAMSRQEKDRRNRTNRARYAMYGNKLSVNHRVEPVRPDPIALAERDSRLSTPPRDLTGWFFGDPPMGYSALERRPVQERTYPYLSR